MTPHTPAGGGGPTLGIIDLGSNTVRLSIVELGRDGAYRVRHEEKAALRLAARLHSDGSLGPDTTDATVAVVRGFAAIGADWGVHDWLAVGTAAVRAATDGAALLAEVQRQTGIRVALLSGTEEAELGLIGALNTLAEGDGWLVDIGGASTELTRFVGRRSTGSVSLPLGAVNAARRFDLEDRAPVGAVRELERTLATTLDGVAPTADWNAPAPGATLVGLGGTVRALAKLDRRERRYPLNLTHHYTLEPVRVSGMAERLAGMTTRERLRLPGVSSDRADLMAAGAAILAWVTRHLRPQRLVVSGSGLREGLFYRHLLRELPGHLFSDVLQASARNLERLHGIPSTRADRLAALAEALWSDLAPLVAAPADLARLAPVAARLRETGTAMGYYDWPRHTFYLLREGRIFGLDHRERLILAAAAGFESIGRLRAALAPYAGLLAPQDVRLAEALGVTAALAHALDRDCLCAALPMQLTVLPSAVRIVPHRSSQGLEVGTLASDFRKCFSRALAVAADAPA